MDSELPSNKKRHHHHGLSNSHAHNKYCKRVRKRKRKDVHSLSDAIITCVPSLVEDVTFTELVDRAIEKGCLTEDECRAISDLAGRKRQIRKVVILITKRSFETMANFLDALSFAYPHLSTQIWHHYKKNLVAPPKRLNSRRLCPLCVLKDNVDVEKVIDDLFSKEIIDNILFERINSSRKNVGQQDKLWEGVLKACVKNKGNEVLLGSLESTRHYTHITKCLRYVLRNNKNMKLRCTCSTYILDKQYKFSNFRTWSVDSATSHSPRETSDSISSTNSDIKSDPETDNAPLALKVTPVTSYSDKESSYDQRQAMITESLEMYDPLINCGNSVCCGRGKMTPEEKSEEKPSIPPKSMESQATGNEPHARHNTSFKQPVSHRQVNKVPDKFQETRRSERFRSVVSAAMMKLRVLRHFQKKENTKMPVETNAPFVSEDMCETVL